MDSVVKAFAVFVFTVLMILAIDVAFTHVYRAVNGYPLFAINGNFRKQSDVYHHDLIACVDELSEFWGNTRSPIFTNSLGFRSSGPVNVELESDKNRVLVIGDSYTEGVGVSFEDSFFGQVSRALPETMEMLNAGVASYSPIIYWRKVKYLIEDVGLKFDQLVVYIDISNIQDEANSYQLSELGSVVDASNDAEQVTVPSQANPLPDCAVKDFSYSNFLWRNTTLVYLLTDFRAIYSEFSRRKQTAEAHNLNHQSMNRDDAMITIADMDRAKWTISDELLDQYGSEGLKKAEFHMQQLSDLLKQNGIDLTVAVYPWPTQVWFDDLDSLQVRFWGNWANENGVGFINHFPDFVKYQDTEMKRNFINSHYIFGDIHLNPAGHRIIADRLTDYLLP